MVYTETVPYVSTVILPAWSVQTLACFSPPVTTATAVPLPNKHENYVLKILLLLAAVLGSSSEDGSTCFWASQIRILHFSHNGVD
jgi:hypothetical protein